MSSSGDEPDAGARGLLRISAPHAQITVVDAWLEPVPGAVGSRRLEVVVPAGAYQVRARVGSFETSEVVLVRAGATRDVALAVEFTTAAPLTCAANFDETHAALVSQELNGYGRRARDPTLLVVVRGIKRDEPLRAGSLQPFRLQGAPYLVKDVEGAFVEGTTGSAGAWPHVLSPGLHRLRWQTRAGAGIEHAVWLPNGWRTVLFVPWVDGGPDIAVMSVHLVPKKRLWDPADEREAAVETAATAWQDATAADLLAVAPDNPMAVLLAQHHLRRRQGLSAGGDPDAVRFLRATLGDHHPDVQALSVELPPSPLPPMLTTSLARQLHRRPLHAPPDPWKMFESLATQHYPGVPWLRWNPEGLHPEGWSVFHGLRGARTQIPPLPVAMDRLVAILRTTALLNDIPLEQVPEQFTTEEIAESLGTTTSFVESHLSEALDVAAGPQPGQQDESAEPESEPDDGDDRRQPDDAEDDR